MNPKKGAFFLLIICCNLCFASKFNIIVNVTPSDAEIWQNGELMGVGTVTLHTNRGVLKIELKREQYISQEIVFKFMHRFHVEKGRDKTDPNFIGCQIYTSRDNGPYNFTLQQEERYVTTTTPVITNIDVKNKYSIRKASNENCEIMHIGITDSLTLLFLKYKSTSEDNNNSICIDDKMYIKSSSNEKKYKLISSLNIPICPAYQELKDSTQIHYFSLAFQPLSKGTKEIDIVESNNVNAFNFYGVSVIPNRIDSIEYLDLLEETPVKEKGEFLKDGKVVKYFIHKGFIIGANLTIENMYGKYYTLYLSIENYTKNRRDFFPSNIATTIVYQNKSTKQYALSYEAYMKKVNKKQNTQSFFNALGESVDAMNSGYSASSSTTNSYGQANSFGQASSFGYFGNANGYVSSNVRTYANSTTNSSTVNYDATANYFARQNARKNVNEFENQQYAIRRNINLGYLKANTIFSNDRINGYVNIPFSNANTVTISIPFNDEVYTFDWKIK